MQDVGESPTAQKWSQFILAFLAMRERRFEEAEAAARIDRSGTRGHPSSSRRGAYSRSELFPR